MKKLLLAATALVLNTVMLMAGTHTLVMADQFGSADVDNIEGWTQGVFTFTTAVGNNYQNKLPAYKVKQKDVRVYADNTLTITVSESEEPMTSIVFSLSKKGVEEQAYITASNGEIAEQTVGGNTVVWSGNDRTVTFTVGSKNELRSDGVVEGSGQLDFTQLDITTGGKPKDTATTYYAHNVPGAVEGTDLELTSWTQGNLKFTAMQGEDATVNMPTLKKGSEIRFYNGNSFTIETVDGSDIVEIEFVLSKQGLEQQAAIVVNVGSMIQGQDVNAKWAGNAKKIAFNVVDNTYGSKPSKNGQFDFTQINIRYDSSNAGVDSVTVTDNAPAEYYTIDGVKVANPTKGLYICRRGNQVTKIIIR